LTPEGEQTIESTKYSYKLEESPNYPGPQDDPVIRTISGTIRELLKKDIGVAAARIRVYNLTNAPPLWPVTDENADSVKFYVFKPYYKEFPISVPITLTKDCRRLGMHSILVREDGCWKSLQAWLMELSNRGFLLKSGDFMEGSWPNYGTRRVNLRSQQRWWSVNGKSFPLMDLPPEVRVILLQHVMGSEIYLDTMYKNGQTHVVQARASRSQWYDRSIAFQPFGPDVPNNNVLLVSKQVRIEALKATWEGTWKHFMWDSKVNFNGRNMRISPFDTVMTAVRPGPWNWISKIELNYSTQAWFWFFNIEVWPRVHFSRAMPRLTNGALLKEISTLKELRLVFPSPYDHRQKHPWVNFFCSAFYTSEEYSNLDANERKLYKDSHTRPCFRTLVDWILTVAFPFVKHVPNIYLKGYIKTKLKENGKISMPQCLSTGRRKSSKDLIMRVPWRR
jgi:hypothetical protein